jgi:hypothetical protein
MTVLPLKVRPVDYARLTEAGHKYVYRHGKGFRVIKLNKVVAYCRTLKKAIRLATALYGKN